MIRTREPGGNGDKDRRCLCQQANLISTPLLNAASDWTFDPDPFGAKAVLLRIDNSAEPVTIGTTGAKINKVSVGNGKTIEQTGTDTVWGTGTNPVLVAPGKRGN